MCPIRGLFIVSITRELLQNEFIAGKNRHAIHYLQILVPSPVQYNEQRYEWIQQNLSKQRANQYVYICFQYVVIGYMLLF